MEQVSRGQLQPPRGEQLLHEVGLQSFLEQRHPGAGADVRAEGDRTPCSMCSRSGNSPLPRAELLVGQCATLALLVRQDVQLAGRRMHVVREDAATADQAVLGVRGEIVVAALEQLADRGDLGEVLVDVRGEPRALDGIEQRGTGIQQASRAGQREPRDHGVAVAAHAVPALGQLQAVVVRSIRRGEQVGPQDPVAHHQPAGDPQPRLRGLGEQRVDRPGKVRAEHQGGRGAGSGQPTNELKLIINLVKPKYFIPIHGEYRQLKLHAEMAGTMHSSVGKAILIESGDILEFDELGARKAGRVNIGRVCIDSGSRTDVVEDLIVKDRRHLSEDGIVLPIIAIHKLTGKVETTPEIVTRGFSPGEDGFAEGARQVVMQTLEMSSDEEKTDYGVIKEKIRTDLKRYISKQTQKRPLIMPVILEI